MRSPKDSFLISGNAIEFRKMVASPAFETACEYALLQLQSDMLPNTIPGKPVDPYLGLDQNAQMFGARRVIDLLHQLGNPPEEPKKQNRTTLHYADDRSSTASSGRNPDTE